MNDPQVVDNATLSLHNLDVEKAAVIEKPLGLWLIESLVQMTTFISRIFLKLVELQFKVPK